jgi:hypothetical protein
MTDPTPTDWRALCAELLEIAEMYSDGGPNYAPFERVLARARALLTQPEPQGPTDEELVELFNENDWNFISPETFIDIARSVLELQ